MVLDRANRGLPSNIDYVLMVEGIFVASVLALAAIGAARRRKRLEAAASSPLDSAIPKAGTWVEEGWRQLAAGMRTAALEAEALKAAEAKAEFEAFLATIHALKTPATTLSLMAEKAEREGSPVPPRELRLEVDELDRILDRALGRLRLGDFPEGSRFCPVDAGEAVSAALRRHRRALIARRIGVGISGSFVAMSDAYWLGFILDQLLSNAAKYAASSLAIILRTEGRSGIIEIGDDGPGFEPEDILRAFGRSATGRAGAALSSAGERGPASTGYGLWLASEAASRCGCRLVLGQGPGGKASLHLPLDTVEGPKLAPM